MNEYKTMNECIENLYDQWENGNRKSVCLEILARPNATVTAVYFAIKLATQQGDPHFGEQEAAVFARILESQTD